MWNGLGSILYNALNRAIFNFVDVIWQYPHVSMVVLITVLVLTLVMWIEILAITAPAKSRLRVEEVRPIRLRR